VGGMRKPHAISLRTGIERPETTGDRPAHPKRWAGGFFALRLPASCSNSVRCLPLSDRIISGADTEDSVNWGSAQMIESIGLDEMSVEQLEIGGDDDAINRFKIEREAQKVEVVALKTEANALEERLKTLKERLDLVSLSPNERVKAEETRSGKPARDLNAGRDSSDQRIEAARDGSEFSAGSQVVVEPSIDASSRASGYQFVSNKSRIGGRISRSAARVFTAALIGAGATFAWQFHGDGAEEVVRTWVSSLGSLLPVSTTKSPLDVDAKQTDYTPAAKVSAQDAALPQPAPVPQTASAPAAPATSPTHSGEQLAAKQGQMSDNIATLQAVEPDIKQNASSPFLQNGTQLRPTPTTPTTIKGWTLRDVTNSAAVLEGPTGGIWRATSGDIVPILGRVNSIVRWGNRWIVATSRGIISMPVGQNASSPSLYRR
jgi:hypothetical protein